MAIAALSSTAQAATGTWTGGGGNNIWQNNANWSVSPFPGATTNVFTSTDAANFSTVGSGTITLGGTGIINVQSIFFGLSGGDANAFTLGASTDIFNFTSSATTAAGGVFINAGVTQAEQIGVAGTTLNLSTTGGQNTSFFNNGTGLLTIGGNIKGNAASAATDNLIFGGTGTGNISVTGNISSATAGTVSFIRDGSSTNTVTLSGTTTTNNGAFLARGGVTNINGAVTTGTGLFEVGGANATARSSTVNIGANVTANNMNIGNVNGASFRTGAVYQTAGTVSITLAAGATDFQLGNAAVSTANPSLGSGYYNLSGGALTANEFDIGANQTGTATTGTVGVMEVTGGTATTNGYLTVGRGTGISSGTVNVTGGTLNTGATAATGPLALNWATLSGGQAVLNVGGGAGAAAVTGGAGTTQTGQFAGRGLNLAESNVAGTQGIANLLTNGTLTVSDVVASQGATSTSQLNFNGGTLKATATNLGATFLTSANISAINVFGNGGTIDNNGTNITVSHSIVAPVGQGVNASTVTVATGGSGYIGAPLVKLTGGSGTGATGYATISGGVVTGITITSPGIGYLSTDTLTASFFGGLGTGGTAATNVTGIAVSANVSGGMTFVGTGATILTGANTYTGATLVRAGGTLTLGTGGSLAGTAVTVGDATTGTLKINGNYTIGTSGSASVNLTGSTGTLSLLDGTINTLTINNSTASAFALSIGGGNTLSFDAGATTGDLINLGAGLQATAGGTNTININLLARPTASQTLTLINAPGGFTGSSNFTLGTISGAVNAANTFGLSLSLFSTATQLQLVETATSAPATAYFTGNLGSASWNANNGSIGNFSTDSAGTNGVTQLPGAATDVHFYATNANTANVAASTLDAVFSIKTLTVDGSTLNESSPVGIAPGTGGSLTITPTDPATGLTINSGAGAVTISAPVTLGAAQTWTNNSANLLTVSGAVTNGANTLTLAGTGNMTLSGVIGAGAGGLIMNGAGTLTLSGTNTYTGGTTVNAGIVLIATNANLGANASSVTLNGGTVSTTGGFTNTHAFTIGASGGTINVNAGTNQLYFHTANTLLGSGPLSLTGSGTLLQSSGNLRVDVTNTYSGTLTASGGGIFEYGLAGAVATGASLVVGNQGEIALQGSPGVTLPNAITVSGGTNSVLSFENGTAGIYSGAITLNANATIGLRDWYNYATVRSGTISGVLGGSGGLSVNSGTGSGGVLTLSAANTFDGAVTINASTVVATNATALGSTVGGTTVNSGAALDVRAVVGNEAVTISGTGIAAGGALLTGTGTGSLAGPITLAANSSIGGAGALTLSGAIGDGGSAFGLTKVGAGTTILTGTSTYTGATTLTAGTLQIGDGTTDGSISSSANIVDNAALVYNRSTGSSFTYGGVISGTGTLTNAGPGTQTLAGAETYTGATSVTAGTLNVTGTLGNTAVTVSAGTLGLQNAGAISQNTLAISGTGVLSETVANAISGTAALAVQTPATTTISLANNYSGGTTIGLNQNNAVLRATASGALGSGTISFDSQGNASAARLELAGGITLGNAIAFTGRNSVSVGIESVSGNNTLSGAITLGTGGSNYYVQSDAGLLTLSGNITPPATGARTVNLQGAGNGLISGVIGFTTGNTLGVTQAGTGTWTLSNTNTYTGATTVSAGTLLVNGSTASGSAVTVSGTGTLGGMGTVGGTVAVNTGGTISPGPGSGVVGNLTTGALTLASGSTFNSLLGGDASISQLLASTTSAAGAFSITLAPGATFNATGEALTLIPSGFTGTFTNSTFTVGGYLFTADYTTTGGGFDVDVSAAPVPEPTTILGGILLVGVAGYRSRRRLSSLWHA